MIVLEGAQQDDKLDSRKWIMRSDVCTTYIKSIQFDIDRLGLMVDYQFAKAQLSVCFSALDEVQ